MTGTRRQKFEDDMKLVEACLGLADFGTSRNDARRGIEWKLSFGLWALMAAATLRGFDALPVFAFLIPIVHAWWLRNLWIRHSADVELAWNFVNEAQRLIAEYGVATIPPKPELRVGYGKSARGWRGWVDFLSDWAPAFQMMISVLLTFALCAAADKLTVFTLVLKQGTL